MTIGQILCSFGTFLRFLVHFDGFWYHAPKKIWQPLGTSRKTGSTETIFAALKCFGRCAEKVSNGCLGTNFVAFI
jgi:hypothetical protein